MKIEASTEGPENVRREWGPRVARSLALIDEAIRVHSSKGREVSAVYGSFSGGHDSLVATDIASRHPLFAGAVHWNTGVGIEDTREYVRSVCRKRGWKLFEIRALEDCGQSYEEMVLEHGFPGPGMHWKMYHRLKERCCRYFFRLFVPRPSRALLVSGRRSKESARRMITVDLHDRVDRTVHCSPIHGWTGLDVTDFIQDHEDLDRNPVVDLLHMSGECLCGAYAKKGELKQLEFWFPKNASYLRDLETRVKEAGFNWGWEEGPPPKNKSHFDPRQTSIDWGDGQDRAVAYFCSSCETRHEEHRTFQDKGGE